MESEDITILTKLAHKIGLCYHSAVYWNFILSIVSLADLLFLTFANTNALNGIILSLLTFTFVATHLILLVAFSTEPFTTIVSQLVNVNLEEVKFLNERCRKSLKLNAMVYGINIFMIVISLIIVIKAPTWSNIALALFGIFSSASVVYTLIENECLAKCAEYSVLVALVYAIAASIFPINELAVVASSVLAYNISLISILTAVGVRECMSAMKL